MSINKTETIAISKEQQRNDMISKMTNITLNRKVFHYNTFTLTKENFIKKYCAGVSVEKANERWVKFITKHQRGEYDIWIELDDEEELNDEIDEEDIEDEINGLYEDCEFEEDEDEKPCEECGKPICDHPEDNECFS